MFTEILPNVFLCSRREANSTYFINTYRPKVIMNFHEEADQVLDAGIVYRHIPLMDTENNDPQDILQALQQMRYFIRNEKYLPVFVHCAEGISRSPGMIALYLYQYEGFNPYQAAIEHVGNLHGDMRKMRFTRMIEEKVIPMLLSSRHQT